MTNHLYRLAGLAIILSCPFNAMAQSNARSGAAMTCAEALKRVPIDDASLMPLAQAFDVDAARLKKAPNDAHAKRAYVTDGEKYLHQVVFGRNKVSPALKYRAALELCALILQKDPTNAESKRVRTQIEGIYRGMERPVPQTSVPFLQQNSDANRLIVTETPKNNALAVRVVPAIQGHKSEYRRLKYFFLGTRAW